MNASSNGVALAKTYASALQSLSKARPGTRFIAVTSPLTRVETGAKAWVKGMIGRSASQQENAVRQKFNAYLRSQFSPDRLYDLAKIESAASAADADAPSLRPDLTDDGGHLNDKGARLAGAAFLKLIASSGK
jgi:lysophospholipase L1-like esterase